MKKQNEDELNKFVYEELSYYQLEWKHDMSDSSIRRGSASLRNLLHENKLQIAWKNAGFDKQPTVLAPSVKDYIINFNIEKIKYIQAGGAISNGIQFSTSFQGTGVLSEKEIKDLYKLGRFRLKPFKLSEFCQSICIIVRGKTISRDELIQYVTNKLGGAHFDGKRETSKNIEVKFLLLDEYRKSFSITDRDPIMFELLSTTTA